MLDFDTLGILNGLILRVWKIKNPPQSSDNLICHWEWGTVIFLPYAWGIAIQPDFHSNETQYCNIAVLFSGILLRDRRTDLIILLLVRRGGLALAIVSWFIVSLHKYDVCHFVSRSRRT